MEIILEFLEQLTDANDHVKYSSILSTLHFCVNKIEDKGKIIEWCIEAMKTYISTIFMPSEEEEEDPYKVINNIRWVYDAILYFLDPLVSEARKINSTQNEGSLLGDSLLSFLIYLCGKPLCYLNKYFIEEPKYRRHVDIILHMACRLADNDILYFVDIVSKRERGICDKAQSMETEIYGRHMLFELSDNIPSLAYANFYYQVITEERYWKMVPQVYNPYYILETCAYFFKILFCKEYLVSDGIIFMETILKRVPSCSVNSEMLRLEIFTELFHSIINVMTYHNNDTDRKKAVDIFQEYIKIFDMESRYNIILYLYENSQHSGLLSVITGIFKSCIIQCLDSSPQNPQFLGKNMKVLLKKACNLPHGSKSDMVELGDEIITALNLLRFLFIRDTNNDTGIWSMADSLKNDFLHPLREGIDLCKAHWRVNKKDLEQQRKDLQKRNFDSKEYDFDNTMKVHIDIPLNVGGKKLPNMPLPEQISFCSQVLNGLDVMESILVRVNECIDIHEKSKENV
ncbi:glomulin isoform X2 [Pogonomyrmex barbatus]|nr:glomulin isoform X2 [Pogonomyrmex barbatus]